MTGRTNTNIKADAQHQQPPPSPTTSSPGPTSTLPHNPRNAPRAAHKTLAGRAARARYPPCAGGAARRYARPSQAPGGLAGLDYLGYTTMNDRLVRGRAACLVTLRPRRRSIYGLCSSRGRLRGSSLLLGHLSARGCSRYARFVTTNADLQRRLTPIHDHQARQVASTFRSCLEALSTHYPARRRDFGHGERAYLSDTILCRRTTCRKGGG